MTDSLPRQPPRLPQPPGERVLIRILPFRPSDCPILQPTDPDGTLLRRQVCICGKRGPWFLGTGRTTRHLNTVFEEFGNVRRSSRETLLPPAKLFVLRISNLFVFLVVIACNVLSWACICCILIIMYFGPQPFLVVQDKNTNTLSHQDIGRGGIKGTACHKGGSITQLLC